MVQENKETAYTDLGVEFEFIYVDKLEGEQEEQAVEEVNASILQLPSQQLL